LLAPLPLLLHSLGAPLGEPVADDYDFLYHARFHANQWLDGGGSLFYWRPLARQAYYGLLGTMMLQHPAVVALLQALMVSLAAVLLYRTLRVRWPAPWAAAAAVFPFIMESARQLIATPTNMQDLGAVLLTAAALHEASRRRLPTALAALLGSLMCKEMAVVAAPLLALLAPVRTRGERIRWAVAALVVVAAWGTVYLTAANGAGLLFARDLFTEPEVLATPWWVRYAWALDHTTADALSLSGVPAPMRLAVLVAALGIVVIALAAMVARPEVRARAIDQWPWIVGGLFWFLGVTATLADVYPEWRSYRSTFGLMGLGVALSALLGPVHRTLPAVLAGLKLAALALSPPPPLLVEAIPGARPTAVTYSELVRVQRFVGLTRRTLLDAYPSLPPGTRIGRHLVPRLAMYGFAGDRALQVWYRDTTVRWLPFGDFVNDTAARPATIVQYEPHAARQIALVSPAAMRTLIEAADDVAHARWPVALAALAKAEALQPDRGADAFFGIVADRRALTLAAQGHDAEAEREAHRALRLWSDAVDSRYVLARLWARAGQFEAATRQLDTLLMAAPEDSSAAFLRRQIIAEITRRAGPEGRP